MVGQRKKLLARSVRRSFGVHWIKYREIYCKWNGNHTWKYRASESAGPFHVRVRVLCTRYWYTIKKLCDSYLVPGRFIIYFARYKVYGKYKVTSKGKCFGRPFAVSYGLVYTSWKLKLVVGERKKLLACSVRNSGCDGVHLRRYREILCKWNHTWKYRASESAGCWPLSCTSICEYSVFGEIMSISVQTLRKMLCLFLPVNVYILECLRKYVFQNVLL